MAGRQGLHLKGKKTGGRTKGTPNKVTASIKEAFMIAFDKRGGIAGLMEWADENPTHFYQIIGKLIPQEVSKTVEHRVPTQITFNAVDMSGGAKMVEFVNKEDVIDAE